MIEKYLQLLKDNAKHYEQRKAARKEREREELIFGLCWIGIFAIIWTIFFIKAFWM